MEVSQYGSTFNKSCSWFDDFCCVLEQRERTSLGEWDLLYGLNIMADTAYWYCYLNTPTDEQVTEFIFWQFEHMWTKYNRAVVDSDREKSRVVVDDVIEVASADLVMQPRKTLQRVYQHAGLHFGSAEEALLEREIHEIGSYQVNRHVDLPADIRQLVKERWAGYIEAFGY